MNHFKTRREFIRNVGLAAGASTVGSAIPWMNILAQSPQKANLPAAETVNIGIIGTGSRGSKLLQHLQLVPGVNIVTLADNYPPHLKKALALTDNKAKGYSSYQKLLEQKEIDGVIISTPIYNHREITVAALQAGKHVLCEKALANTVENAKLMVEAHRATGKNLQIGHQRMFDLKYLKGLEKVLNHEFGEITHIRSNWYINSSWRKPNIPPGMEKQLNWRMHAEQCHGLMSELACHITQVANWFIGDIPEYAVGSGSINYYKDGRTTYDNVNVIYQYPNGVNFAFNAGLTNWHYGLEEQVMGPKATMELEKGIYYLQNPPPAPGIKQLISDLEKSVFETVPIGGASWIVKSGNDLKGELLVDKYPLPDSTTLELEAFVNSIRDNKQIPEVLEQAYYGTVAAILGQYAMEKREAVYLTEEMKI